MQKTSLKKRKKKQKSKESCKKKAKKAEKKAAKKEEKKAKKEEKKAKKEEKKVEKVEKKPLTESEKKDIHDQCQKIKELPTEVITTYTQTIASDRCGNGEQSKECRERVAEYSKTQETLFRVSALKSCKCEKTITTTDGESTKTVVKTCTNSCLKRSCKIRALNECVTLSDHTSCVNRVYEKCTALHLK